MELARTCAEKRQGRQKIHSPGMDSNRHEEVRGKTSRSCVPVSTAVSTESVKIKIRAYRSKLILK